MEIPWGGIACCLSAAALYMLGRNSGRDAAVLNSVTRVSQVKDLVKLLDIGSKLLPLIVAISGKVGSTAPIKCECSGLRGVIVEETAEQLFLKHNDVGSWIQDSALILSLSKEVPWYLDDGTGKVCVVGARGAAGFGLTVCSEVFEESGRSLVRGTLDYLQGLKMLGVKRIERVLPMGTSLTVVGEVVKDDIGTMRIQKPIKGPFYVSTRNLDELIGNLGKWARLYKFASLSLALYGSFVIAKHVLMYFMARRRQREFQDRQVFAAAAKQGEKCENVLDGNKSDRKVPDLCVVCLEKEYDAVFLKCGHMCCCLTCSSYLNCCPLCRRKIDQVVKTFRH